MAITTVKQARNRVRDLMTRRDAAQAALDAATMPHAHPAAGAVDRIQGELAALDRELRRISAAFPEAVPNAA